MQAINLRILESRLLQHRTDPEPMASSTAINENEHNHFQNSMFPQITQFHSRVRSTPI